MLSNDFRQASVWQLRQKNKGSNGSLRCSLAGTLPQVLRQTSVYCRAVYLAQAALLPEAAEPVAV